MHNGQRERLPFGEIIPIRGFGLCGELEGINVAGLHKNAIGLAMAAEEYGARFFGNGARPGGILSYDKVLGDEQRERIRERIESTFGGQSNAHKVMVLEAGMEWTGVTTPNNASQFVETRKNQVVEIARIFNVPPHKLYEMDKATYNNVEQENRAFAIDTLMPYVLRIEEALNCFLLSQEDQDDYFFKFNMDARLRADSKTRAEELEIRLRSGQMTINEARAKENLPPMPDGDKLFMPLNTAPIDLFEQVLLKSSAAAGGTPTPADDEDDD